LEADGQDAGEEIHGCDGWRLSFGIRWKLPPGMASGRVGAFVNA
jgi:hypothetical protein